MALRLDWLRNRCLLHLRHWPYRSYIPHQLSRREQSFLRYLGLPVAGVQSRCHGLYLVWSPIVDWRAVILLFITHRTQLTQSRGRNRSGPIFPLPPTQVGVLTLRCIIGQCVTLMIQSIWTKYADVPNSMPKNSGTDTKDFVSFFLFWLCSLPAIWFPVHQIRHLFTVKAFFVPMAGVTYFIWAIVKAHGIGPIVHRGSTKAGGALGWAMVSGIMSSIANFATLIGTVHCLTTSD